MLDQTSKIGCDCVIAGGEWHPCPAHDLELASLEATGGVGLDRIPLADAGFSILRMPGSSGRHPEAWHRTDTHMGVTPRGKAPDRSSRAVTYSVPDVVQGWPSVTGALRVIGGAFVRLDEPKCPRLAEVVLREAVAEERERRNAAREVRAVNQPTTGRARAQRRGEAQARGMRARPQHNESREDGATMRHGMDDTPDVERLQRLSAALAVVGDTWADRQG